MSLRTSTPDCIPGCATGAPSPFSPFSPFDRSGVALGLPDHFSDGHARLVGGLRLLLGFGGSLGGLLAGLRGRIGRGGERLCLGLLPRRGGLDSPRLLLRGRLWLLWHLLRSSLLPWLRRRRWPSGAAHRLQLIDGLLILGGMFRLGDVILVGNDVRRLRFFLHQVRRHVQIDLLFFLLRRHLHRIDDRGLLQKFPARTVENPPENEEMQDDGDPDGLAHPRRKPGAFKIVDDFQQLMRRAGVIPRGQTVELRLYGVLGRTRGRLRCCHRKIGRHQP